MDDHGTGGVPIDDELGEQLAADAEAGYDPDRRRTGDPETRRFTVEVTIRRMPSRAAGETTVDEVIRFSVPFDAPDDERCYDAAARVVWEHTGRLHGYDHVPMHGAVEPGQSLYESLAEPAPEVDDVAPGPGREDIGRWT